MGCSICGRGEVSGNYSGEVCADCDRRAVNEAGLEPRTDSLADDGENPVFIDGFKCWRRSRLEGWVTMRDDTPCSSLDEFYGITAFSEYGRELVIQAVAALEAKSEPIMPGLSVGSPVKAFTFKGAPFSYRDERWVVCRTALDPREAQLLDAAVAYVRSYGAERALAILDPPPNVEAANGAGEAYLRRYQSVAWHGFKVAFVPADTIDAGWKVSATRPPSHSGWLDDIAAQVRVALDGTGLEIESYKNSREAEKHVVPILDRLLKQDGFSLAGVTYKTFWRDAQADGVWTRAGGSPNRVHLEVKLAEDFRAPFCQVVEGLGVADAVIQVRLVQKRSFDDVAKTLAKNPWLPELKHRLEAELPIRFIEVGPVV